MEGRRSFLTFWGIFVIVTAFHIALLGVTLEQNRPASLKPPKKIRISLAAVGSAAAAKRAPGPPKAVVMPKPPPKKNVPKPKKKRPCPEKETVKHIPLEQAQLLAAPPVYEPPADSAAETPGVPGGARGYGGSGVGAGGATGTGVPSAAAVEAESGYIRYLRVRLRKLTYYPMKARKMRMQGWVEVTFVIMPDGKVRDVRISVPCPYKVLNDATEEMIRSITRFRPLPPELAGEPLEVTVPVIYKLK
jgi:protein TonB